MKKQTMKRIFTVVLAVCMLLSIAPVTMAADTADGGYQKGDIIEFGSYPQSKVTNPRIISALDGFLTDDVWVSYDYYIGTDTEYDGKMTASDYMKYADLELNGEKYRAVRFSQYRPTVTSDVSSEATSVQDNNGYELNTTYFFKYEPLTWTILDPEEGYVMSNIAIDAQAYENFSYYDPDSFDSASGPMVYNGKDCKYLANDWSKCSLREWLNRDFFNTAFTAEEKAQIGKTYLNNNNSFNSSLDGAGTFDKIFTISFYDAINSDYGFDEGGSRSDLARVRPATDYAMCQGAEVVSYTGGNIPYWWLRTTGLYGAFAFGVAPGGWIVSSGGGYYNVNRTDMGVVPAFKFNPKTPTLAKGSKIEFGSYPQSEVTDADEVAKLEADSENYLWVSYKYYSGTGNSTDGEMEPGDFMLYKDFYSGGEMFRAVTFSEYRPGTGGGLKGDVFSNQKDNDYHPNNVYYFKYEPLTWRVLDPDEGYIMCDNIIDSQSYQNFVIRKDDKLYNSKDCTNYVSDWETCSLRQWLNKTFYNTAFSREEKMLIGTTFLENNSPDGTWFGTDTGDKIFILSFDDVINSAYGFDPSKSEFDEARKLKGTDYSKCQGVYISQGYPHWWLRTPGDAETVYLVSSYGWAALGQGVYGTGVGVVPALKLNPKAVDVSVVYDLDGGAWAEGYTAPTSYKANETLALPTAENVVRAGYTFSGWEQTSLINKTVTYTAKWIANGYIVSFDSNGGTAVADKFLAWSDKVLDGVSAPTKAGYTFAGWRYADSAVSSDTKFSDLAADDKVSGITLVAEWTAKTYTIKFDTRGGTPVADKTLHWDDKVLDGVVPPTKEGGFEFIGWNIVSPKLSVTTLNCTYGELVQDDSIDTVTLGAVWRDTEKPVIIGLENGKIYCGPQKFKVTDNDTSSTAIVIINGKNVEPDADGYYTAEPANGEFKIIAVDSFANMAMVQITVNAAHDYSDWKFDENEHWKECKYGDSVIEKGEHTFEWVTDKEATETEKGIAHEECTVCHAKRNENTEVQKLKTKWEKIRDWIISILVKIIKWFIDLIKDVC
mgnify:FL=1